MSRNTPRVIFQRFSLLIKTNTTMHRVFTYGTLKTGQPNHYFMTEQDFGVAQFVGAARTIGKWPLVTAGRYNTPYVLDCKDTGKQVKGEVYDVDDAMLQKLDQLEHHPDYYIRDKVKIQYLSDNEGNDVSSQVNIESVDMYFLQNFKQELLHLEFKEEFDTYLVPYTAPKDRPKQIGPKEHWWDVKHKPST